MCEAEEIPWFALPTEGNSLDYPARRDVGGKGAGLLVLPPGWTPSTVFLSPAAHAIARREGYSAGVMRSIFDRQEVLHAVNRLGSGPDVLVRSDASSETIVERGTYSSLQAPKRLDDIAERALKIWNEADDLGEDSVGLIIQTLLHRRAHGHLSNEQRLNREADSWTLETYRQQAHETTQWRVSERDEMGDGELGCASWGALHRRLRSVAAHFTNYSPRHHLEWVWDGMRLWLVQADPVQPRYGPPPGELWRPRVGLPLAQRLSTWTELVGPSIDRHSSWPKVNALRSFAAHGLPTPEVWCLTEVDGLLSEPVPPELLQDLERLTSGHTVIRTDVAASKAHFMLPKTPSAITDAAAALRFMRETVSSIRAQDPSARIAFLAHRFLRSRSSAWSYALPKSPIVTVDSTWGLADGLGWLPHDTFVVDVRTGAIRSSVNGKTHFLDVAGASGEWEYRESPSDWIWRSSLTQSQVLQIAEGAWAMAQDSTSPQLTMWFAGMLDGPKQSVLPWFQVDHAIPLEEQPAAAKGLNRRTIRTERDLEDWLLGAEEGNELLVLEPEDSLLRDKGFVARIADSSKVRGACIEISGSPLAHPYYLLTKAGATVICPMPPPVNVTFNKLVRDQVPDAIERGGEHVSALSTSGDELEELLRAKLIEEAFEVAESSGEALIEELADLQQVVRSLLSLKQISVRQVESVRRRKLSSRGGFGSGLVLRRTSSQELHDPSQVPLPGFELTSQSDDSIRGGGDRGLIRLDRIPPRGVARRSVLLSATGVVIHFEIKGRDIRFHVEATSGREADDKTEGRLPMLDETGALGAEASVWRFDDRPA